MVRRFRIGWAHFRTVKEVLFEDHKDARNPIANNHHTLCSHLHFIHGNLNHLTTPGSLLLILYQLDVILGNLLVLLQKELLDLITHVALDHNLLSTTRGLGHAASCRELLAKVLCDFLELETEGLKTRYRRDVFALITLYSLDVDLRRGDYITMLLLLGLGLLRLLLSIFLGAFLGFDRETGSRCG